MRADVTAAAVTSTADATVAFVEAVTAVAVTAFVADVVSVAVTAAAAEERAGLTDQG